MGVKELPPKIKHYFVEENKQTHRIWLFFSDFVRRGTCQLPKVAE